MEFARPSNGHSLDRYDTEKISDGHSSLSMNNKSHVHVHNSTATQNGTTSPVDCWACTTELAEWKKRVQEITERCDLSGLSTEPTKYQLASTGVHGAVLELEYRSATIPDKVRTGLNMICTRGRLTPESLILFAVHKMLKGFGNGSHTVTVAFSPRQDGLSWVVVPSVADHRTQDHQTMASALDEASNYLAPSHSKSESIVIPGDLVRGELLDIIVVFDSASEARPPLPCFPLILWVNMQHEDWTLSLQYASRLLSTMVGDSLLGALQTLLASALDPTRLVQQIELLPPKQLAQLNLWNYTDGEYPSDKRLHHLFEEVTLEAGDHIALICGEKKVTYTALNKQANQLAHFIISIGVQPEQLVGLFLDKSETMIAVILGIWKSGAAYTPIDPAYPDDRVRFILDDTQVRTIVASQKYVARLENAILSDRTIRIVPLEPLLDTLHQQSSSESTHNLSHLPLTSKQLAYVTYTSGTTGFPKGIYKEHTSVVNSITDLSVRYGVSGCDNEVILLFSAYVFEPFVRQMLMALTTGNRLVIISDEDKFDPDTLLPFIRKHKVTYLNGTASVLQEYDLTSCPSLKRMILVGENLTDARYGALRRRFKARIFNEYGFTESAFVTALKIFEPASERKDMSLGRPVRNVKCYILDANLRRVPLGVTGELHIGGMGISRGYMNRDDLTRTKFLKNPYQTESEAERGVNGLMYKTGDLARWLPSGEVEYLGRADFQIKLRGIRIEPGEIESTLATFPGIRTSIVVSKKLLRQGQETREDFLVGYFVCDEATLPENDILAFLEHKLPRYMIPARLVQLKQIPVTINGKADLRALPIVNVAVPAVSSVPTRRDDFADKLADIWADVLQVPSNTIALDQSFFRQGGHSITCIQLIARMRQHLGRAISLEQVFQAKTLRAMADLLRTQPPSSFDKESNDAEFNHDPRTTNKSDGGACLANSLQQGFVYHSLKTLQSEAYIMQSTLYYQLPLSMEKYRDAWASVQRRHPALRLRFAWDNEVTQMADEELIFDWRIIDWSTITETEERGSLMHDLYQADRSEGFNLGKGPLMRLYFVQLARGEAFCLFSSHHSILDGWSQPILFEQVHEAYLKLVDGTPLAIETDHSYMQSQLYLQHHRQDHLDFWSKQLDQVEERCDMSSLLNESARYKVPLADYDRIKEQRQQTVQLAWNESTMKQLQAECLNEGLTIHSVLQLVWHLVLHAYGGGTTITGTTISGRHLPIVGIERSIGMFINTLPLVFDHGGCRDMTALEAMSHVQDQVNAMNSRGNVELGRLRKDDLKHGLFDSLFVLENYPSLDTSQRIAHQKRLGCHIEGGMETLSYPLAVIAREHGTDGCSFTLCYAGELFADDTIEVLLHTVRDAFAQITQNVHVLLRDLEYLSVGQKQQLAEWNSNEAEFPNATIHAVFESEAQQHPNKVAVVYEDVQLTYRQLNSRANALAHHLLSNVSIQPNNLVALVMEKSEHMITSIFAVWKTGGAYVPIDPNYPEHRIKYILQDTRALAVITDQAYLGRIEGIVEGEIPVMPSDEALRLPPSPVHPASSCLASDLAYVMYTSGTTGLPKGVMVEHHGVVNLAVSLSHIFGLRDTDDEVILSFSNYVFDHFVEQMTDALLNGQTLVVLNDEMRGDKERLYRYIEQNKVTYLSGTPSVISMYEFDRFRSHMRRIDCVGEAFSEPVFDKIRETFPGLVINGYGPTEVSITTSKRLYQFPERRTNKSIGSQISNSTSYVLNADMKRVPIGAVGELFLGGDGVARGYHNRPELTAERFPRNPFQTEEERRQGRNGRLYKTGDLVRWIPDSAGEVEYLGRNDFQVKIRGQRIELGEIEAILSSYAGIDQSIVLAKDRETDGQKYLVGYYVASSTTLNTQAIRSYMKMRLPDYMVPSRLILTNEFPVTVSGKLDTKALPLPAEAADEEVVPPRTDTERALARIWAEVLEVPLESIGVYSDFFGLGGDSLKSTRLSFAASKALGVAVSVGSLFSHPTLEGLSRWIETDAGKLEEVETHLNGMQSEFPLSPAQQRLLFMHELGGDGDGSAYNISWHIKLQPGVSLEALDKALRNVLERHEALRTLVKGDGDEFEYFQKIVDNAAAQKMFKIRVLEVDSESRMRHKMTEADNHSFNLDFALPFLVCVYHLSENGRQSIYASFVFHHIAFDAWSWGLFTKDLNSFYSVHTNQQTQPELPPLRVQYKEYSIEHRKTLDSDQRQVLSAYWLKKLSDFEPLHLITDHPRPSQFDYAGRDLKFSLEKEHHDQLRCLARDQGTSLYTVVASAFVLLMGVYTGQQDVVIGVPVSHRTRAEFESVVGFFVNLLPLRVQTCQTDIRGLIYNVQKELVNVQSHQDLPFQDIAKLLHADHDLSRHPISQVVFNWETLSEKSDVSVLAEKCQPSDALPSVAKFDLNVTIQEGSGSLDINFNYATNLFEEKTVRGFMNTFQHILEQFVNGPSISLHDLSYASKPQGPFHSISCNSNLSHSATRKSLSHIFEEYVSITPESVAVTDGIQRISYHDINIRANQVAHYISPRVKIAHGDRIGLVLDKSIDMIVSILAVWKLGAAYVPLDPSYPAQRIKYILEATEARAVLTTSKHSLVVFKTTGVTRVVLDGPEMENVLQQSKENIPTLAPEPCSPAYVIFTSGTTGKPKGVVVEHQSVATLRDALVKRYFDNIHGPQAILFLSNYVFDFSLEQFCLSILSGNKLIIPPEEGLTHEAFYTLANNERLTYMSGTPSVLQQIEVSRLQHLEMLTVAGEEFHERQYQSLRLQFKGQINNAYGITETTVYNVVTSFKDSDPFTKMLKNPLPGTYTYVLDKNLQPVPENAVGELYIGGECLSRGYLGQDDLTKERFIPSPFTVKSNNLRQRLYKTGDMVQFRGLDGIRFIGRRDLQVKLHGLRIELSEIRDAVLAIPEVKAAIVVPRHAKGRFNSGNVSALDCFYTVLDGHECTPTNIRAALSLALPHFMVPSRVYLLPGSLPVTINGKIDVRRLSELTDRSESDTQAHIKPSGRPRNPLEVKLCDLWASLLGMTQCGIDDDLFALGGDSMSSLRLVGEIHRKLGRNITVKDIFIHRTIRALCDHVIASHNTNSIMPAKADQGLVEGVAPLLPIQEWFLSKQLNNPSFWNHCFTIRTSELVLDRLSEALQRLHERHDVFRMRLAEVEGKVVQKFLRSSMPVKLEILDIKKTKTAKELEETLTRLQSQLNVYQGPVYTVVYIHGYQDGSARIWFALHHLIVDTLSWSIITSDLKTLYQGDSLGLKSSSVRQWALAMKDYEIPSAEKAYWDRTRERVLQNAHLIPPPVGITLKCEETLTTAKTTAVYQEICARLGVGVHEILLMAVAAALQKRIDGGATIITVEGHGREDSVDPSLDASRTVGWFTTMYPLELPKVKDVVQGVLGVKDAVAKVPNNGVGYGPAYGYTQGTLPTVSVNYLGRLDQSQQGADGWNVEIRDDGLPRGLCTSPEDATSSLSMADVTFFTSGGQLTTQLSCAWGSDAAHDVIHTIQRKIEELIETTTDPTFILPPPQTNGRTSFEPYYHFKDGSRQGSPVFLLPPGEGGAESYFHNIVSGLPDRNLVAFNNYYRHSKDLQTIEELAEYYLSYIKSIQPQGPYDLLGWSFGGILALDIAQRLASQGDHIGTLSLIDPYFDVPGATKAIGQDQGAILDPIYDVYQPDTQYFQVVENSTDHIILFKASRSDDEHGTPLQRRLYDWYTASPKNNLDKYISPEAINVVPLDGTHFTWVRYSEQVHSMCKILE